MASLDLLQPANVTLIQNIRKDFDGSIFTAQTDNDELLSAKVFDLNIDFLTTQIKQQVAALIQKKNKSLSQLKHPFLHKFRNATVNDQFTKLHCYYDKVNMTSSNDSNAAVSCLSALCKEKALTEKDAAFYIAQIVLAIEELHKNGLLFGYLTIDSILVEEDGYIKLFDYSLLPLECFANVNKSIVPDVYKSTRITKATDWKAVGAIAFQLLTTLKGNSINDVISCSNLSHSAADFLLQLLERDPKKRLANATNISKHSFFNNIDWELLLKKAVKPPMVEKEDNNDIQEGEDAQLSIDDFEILEVVGRGPFSKVMKVKQKNNGKIWAMKVVAKDTVFSPSKYAKKILDSTTIPACQHVNTTKFVIETVEKLYLFSELLQGGFLCYEFLTNTGKCDGIAPKFYAAELVLALECLHNNNIICKNLYPSNVLLDAEGHICLTDVGLAPEVHNGDNMHLNYLAPELLETQNFAVGKEVDFWSFGIWLFELLTGKPPYCSQATTFIEENIMENVQNKYCVTSEAKDLISKLLAANPMDRLTSFKEIKCHSFFKLIDWKALSLKEITAPIKPTVEQSIYSDLDAPVFTRIDNTSGTRLNTHICDSIEYPGAFDGFDFNLYDVPGYSPPPKQYYVCSLNGGHFHMKRGEFSESRIEDDLSKLRLQSTHSFSIYRTVKFEQPIMPDSHLLDHLRNSYLEQIFVFDINSTASCSKLNFAKCIAELLVSRHLKTLYLPTSFIVPLTESLLQLEKPLVSKLSAKNINITFHSPTFSQTALCDATTLLKLLNSYTSNPATILYEFEKCLDENQLVFNNNQQEVQLACKLFSNTCRIYRPIRNAKHIHICNAPSANELKQLWTLPNLQTITVSSKATQQLIDAFVELDRTNNWPTHLSTIGFTRTTVDNKKQLISLIKSGNNEISNLMLEQDSGNMAHLELLIEESVQHLNGLFVDTTSTNYEQVRQAVTLSCSKAPFVKLRKFGTIFRDEILPFGACTDAVEIPNSIRNIHLLEKEGRNVLVSLLMISSIRSNELFFLPFEVIWMIVSYCDYCSFVTCYQHRSHFLYDRY